MSYSPYAHTTATSGHVGLVRLGTGIGGQSDGTIITTSAPNEVLTSGSYADPSWITSLSASKIGGGSPTFTGLTVNQATSLNTTTINNGKLLLGLYDQLIETSNNEFSLASGASYTGTADNWTQNQPYLWSSRITQGQMTQVAGSLIRVQYTNTNASSVTWQDALRIDTSGNTIIPTKTASSSPNTGALQVVGGVGVGGDLNVNGNLAVSGNAKFGYSAMTVFTSGSGNWTVPAGVTRFKVTVIGGGGGGAGSFYHVAGAGGGGGATCIKYYNNATPGTSYSYSVGTGGTGGLLASPYSGTNGSTSTFDTVSAGGGSGGSETNVSVIPISAGGTATGGTLNINGGASTNPIAYSSEPYVGGNGGNSTLGFGGSGASINGGSPTELPAQAGTGYGAGGGGAGGTGTRNGAVGSAGVIIIEY